jgi:hypothetical protein
VPVAGVYRGVSGVQHAFTNPIVWFQHAVLQQCQVPGLQRSWHHALKRGAVAGCSATVALIVVMTTFGRCNRVVKFFFCSLYLRLLC